MAYLGWHWPIILMLGIIGIHWHDAHADDGSIGGFVSSLMSDPHNEASAPSNSDDDD